MRVIVIILLFFGVILAIYFAVPAEEIRSKAKDTIHRVNAKGPSLNFDDIQSEVVAKLNEQPDIPEIAEDVGEEEKQGAA